MTTNVWILSNKVANLLNSCAGVVVPTTELQINDNNWPWECGCTQLQEWLPLGVSYTLSLPFLLAMVLLLPRPLVRVRIHVRTQVTDLVLHFLRDHKHDTNRSTICMHMVATLTLVFYLPVDHDPVL